MIELIESPADRLRDYLLYHVEWICLTIFLIAIIALLAGQVVGQNDHIRELERPPYDVKIKQLHDYMRDGVTRWAWRQEYCK